MFKPSLFSSETFRLEKQDISEFNVVLHENLKKFLCTLAIEIWRLHRKVERLNSNITPDDQAGLSFSVNRLESGLRDIGLECREYTNQPYDAGMQLTVLAYEPHEGVHGNREIIHQTVSPSVFFGGQLLQQGEVVVSSCRQEVEENR